MAINRRKFLKHSVTLSLIGLAASAGLITPKMGNASWSKKAFDATSLDTAIEALVGQIELIESNNIHLKAPNVAENGAVVPITVTSSIEAVESIAVFVEKNPIPLIAHFRLAPATEAFASARVKMAETSDIIIIVKANNQLYTTRKKVKVTIGGCGG